MSMNSQYTILVVGETNATLQQLGSDLTNQSYTVTFADSGEEALSILTSEHIDLVLLNFELPSLSGLETLTNIQSLEKRKNIPVIMLSSSDDNDSIIQALDLGAFDYVEQPYITNILISRVNNAIKLAEQQKMLETMAKSDNLTGLSNRKVFYKYAQKLIQQSNRMMDYPVIVVIINIDDFKNVNENYGYDIGNNILKSFAQLLQSNFREYDLVARISSEEFAVCLPKTTIKEALYACERFRKQIEAFKFKVSDDMVEHTHITTSLGIASSQGQLVSLDDLMKQADDALCRAKSEGRNRIINGTYPMMDKDNLQTEKEEKLAGIDVSIGLKNVLDDKNLFDEILVMFHQDHHQDGDKLRQALTQQDILTSKHLAHTLKGVACSIGAMTLFEHTKMLDEAINTNEAFEVLMTCFEPVESELAIVIEGIVKELGDKLSH